MIGFKAATICNTANSRYYEDRNVFSWDNSGVLYINIELISPPIPVATAIANDHNINMNPLNNNVSVIHAMGVSIY